MNKVADQVKSVFKQPAQVSVFSKETQTDVQVRVSETASSGNQSIKEALYQSVKQIDDVRREIPQQKPNKFIDQVAKRRDSMNRKLRDQIEGGNTNNGAGLGQNNQQANNQVLMSTKHSEQDKYKRPEISDSRVESQKSLISNDRMKQAYEQSTKLLPAADKDYMDASRNLNVMGSLNLGESRSREASLYLPQRQGLQEVTTTGNRRESVLMRASGQGMVTFNHTNSMHSQADTNRAESMNLLIKQPTISSIRHANQNIIPAAQDISGQLHQSSTKNEIFTLNANNSITGTPPARIDSNMGGAALKEQNARGSSIDSSAASQQQPQPINTQPSQTAKPNYKAPQGTASIKNLIRGAATRF